MADIVIDRIAKDFGAITRPAGDLARRRRRRVRRAARPVRLRQDHAAAHHRRARDAEPRAASSSAGATSTDLPPRERGLAMVFQNYAVFPHMTVFENIAFGLRMQRRRRGARRSGRSQRAAELLHIEPLLDRYPAKLSGGQRQRVAVARALAVEPAGAADGRAAVQPRRAAAARDARRAQGACCARPARRRSTSPTTRPRRWASPTASP